MFQKPIPAFFRIFFIIAFVGFFLDMYIQKRFTKTYSRQRTEDKVKEISSHGVTYYVNESEYRKARLVEWIAMPAFYLSIIGIIIYKLKTNPRYFSTSKKRKRQTW